MSLRKMVSVDPKSNLLSKYNASRMNLLLVAVFSAINFVLLVSQSNTYFLFSAAIPYIVTDLFMLMCRMYPEEYYEEITDMIVLPEGAFVIAVLIVFAIIAVYVLCYIFSSKNRVAWLIAALTFFVIDTAVMFLWYVISIDIMLDIIFHVWVIVSLSMGIAAHFKLKRLPEEDPLVYEADPNAPSEEIEARPDSTVLRAADTEVKSRVLLELTAFDRSIVYRRVKRVNELVIDGNVYDEYVALFERSHMLTANVDGHAIAVGFNSVGFSYAMIDGVEVARKPRFV